MGCPTGRLDPDQANSPRQRRLAELMFDTTHSTTFNLLASLFQ